MAENKILNSRLCLKYDSYENWSKAENQKDLLAGEIAIAYLTTAEAVSPATGDTQHPVLIKVGPGKFNDLPWLSALAADVYDWAKKENPDWNDFPALPIEIIDNGTGKFITDIEYANNKITISRANVVAADIADAPWVDKDTVTTIAAGAGVEVTSDNAEDPTYTVSHANTSDVANVVAADRTYVKALTFDDFGHVTAVQTGTETVVDTNTVTTVRAGGLMGEIKDEGKDGNHDYVINGKDWSGEIATALADAKKYADDNDANDNTAHTHIDGIGVKVTGNGGIEGKVKIDLDVKFNESLVTKGDKKYLQLLDATDNALISEFDVTEFVKDGMLQSVVVDEAANKITFTWNTDGNATETTVELDKIADIYTGSAGADITINVSNENIISATLNKTFAEKSELTGYKTVQEAYSVEGSTVKTVTKVEQNANGEVTITYSDIAFPAAPDYTDEFAGKKDKQTAVANKISDAAHVLASLSQNENGDIAYEVKKLTPADIGAQPAGNYQEAGNYKVTQAEKTFGSEDHKWVNSITQNANGEIEATLSRPSGYDLEEVSTAKNTNNEDVPCFIFYCGTASDLV